MTDDPELVAAQPCQGPSRRSRARVQDGVMTTAKNPGSDQPTSTASADTSTDEAPADGTTDQSPVAEPADEAPVDESADEALRRKYRDALARKHGAHTGETHSDAGSGKPTHGSGPATSQRMFRRKSGG